MALRLLRAAAFVAAICVGSVASSVLPALGASASAPAGVAGPTEHSLKSVFSVKTRQPVFFITIDDGTFHTKAALNYVRRNKLPVTVFLTANAVAGDWNYFKKITKYGSPIQNHTISHADLTKASSGRLHDEICRTQRLYAKHFGQQPTMLRPPYGAGGFPGDAAATRERINDVARSCGITHVAMWDAVWEKGSFTYIHGKLTKGDIVLLHFNPDLDVQLRTIMAAARAAGLRPEILTNYVR